MLLVNRLVLNLLVIVVLIANLRELRSLFGLLELMFRLVMSGQLTAVSLSVQVVFLIVAVLQVNVLVHLTLVVGLALGKTLLLLAPLLYLVEVDISHHKFVL